MDKQKRRQAAFTAEAKGKGFTVKFVGNGEVVRYFDGQRSIDCELSWSWKEPAAPGASPTRTQPVHIHADTLSIVGPGFERQPVAPSERQFISDRIKQALEEQGVASVIK
jgi:hypothetical protein